MDHSECHKAANELIRKAACIILESDVEQEWLYVYLQTATGKWCIKLAILIQQNVANEDTSIIDMLTQYQYPIPLELLDKAKENAEILFTLQIMEKQWA